MYHWKFYASKTSILYSKSPTVQTACTLYHNTHTIIHMWVREPDRCAVYGSRLITVSGFEGCNMQLSEETTAYQWRFHYSCATWKYSFQNKQLKMLGQIVEVFKIMLSLWLQCVNMVRKRPNVSVCFSTFGHRMVNSWVLFSNSAYTVIY